MKNWLRRIRGAIGIGLAWAVAWFGAGMILLLVVGLDAADVPFPLFFGLLGFLAGVTFAGILGLVEGRRGFDQMSMPRFALWGGVGGLLLSMALSFASGAGAFPVLAVVFALVPAALRAVRALHARAQHVGSRLGGTLLELLREVAPVLGVSAGLGRAGGGCLHGRYGHPRAADRLFDA